MPAPRDYLYWVGPFEAPLVPLDVPTQDDLPVLDAPTQDDDDGGERRMVLDLRVLIGARTAQEATQIAMDDLADLLSADVLPPDVEELPNAAPVHGVIVLRRAHPLETLTESSSQWGPVRERT